MIQWKKRWACLGSAGLDCAKAGETPDVLTLQGDMGEHVTLSLLLLLPLLASGMTAGGADPVWLGVVADPVWLGGVVTDRPRMVG